MSEKGRPERAGEPVRAKGRPVSAARTLAAFAHGLRYEDIPPDVRERARVCILDTAAVAIYGARFPWSRTIADYARRYGAGGRSTLLGVPGGTVHAPQAAFANGAAAHAFEQDSLRAPGAGVHPGACLLPPALAVAEERGAAARDVLVAFVAGCEVLFRIGDASRHSSETLGFHAPGLTGPYGAAVASGVVAGLTREQLAAALGIAGSLSAGLLAFSAAQQGAEVKKLHLGRAAEAGVVAASLAGSGFGGPDTVLEGRHGYLQAFCRDAAPERLTAGLGEVWETLNLCIKRYPCHVTAHTPVQAVRDLMAEGRFTSGDVAEVEVEVSAKVLAQHDIREPADIQQGQYSVPFCVALALHRNPLDPVSFDRDAVDDERIRAACRAVRLSPFRGTPQSGWHTRVALRLNDGRRLVRDAPGFTGMPANPVGLDEIRAKYRRLAGEPQVSHPLIAELTEQA
jgi:2-methylcitrate dehydratase PrpD